MPGDHVEVKPLGAAGLVVHEERQAFLGAVGKPFLECQAVADLLRDLLPALVEKELIRHVRRRPGAKHAGDLRPEFIRRDQVLAVHLVVDVERDPAHRPVRLPLQLAASPRHGRLDFRPVLVAVGDRTGIGISGEYGGLQDPAGRRADRQERAVGRAPLTPQRGKDDLGDFVVVLQHHQQRLIEDTAAVAVRRAPKLVVKPEPVEEVAELGVVVFGKALVLAERVGNVAQGAAQVSGQHGLLGHVGRHAAQTVHVVGERDQPGRHPGHGLEGVTDHGRAGYLAEGPDVGQARGSESRLEQHVAFLRQTAAKALRQSARFVERPGAGLFSGGAKRGHGWAASVPGSRVRVRKRSSRLGSRVDRSSTCSSELRIRPRRSTVRVRVG